MKDLFKKRNKAGDTIYILGDSFYADPKEELEVVEQGVPPLIQAMLSTTDPEEMKRLRKEQKEWEKENDPNYYVHPKYWYKRYPGTCGQGFSYATETYYERLAERRKEQEAKLKAKFPPAVVFIVGRYVVEALAEVAYEKAEDLSWDIRNHDRPDRCLHRQNGYSTQNGFRVPLMIRSLKKLS